MSDGRFYLVSHGIDEGRNSVGEDGYIWKKTGAPSCAELQELPELFSILPNEVVVKEEMRRRR